MIALTAAAAIGVSPLILAPVSAMADTGASTIQTAAAANVTDITSVGTVQLAGVTDADGNTYSGTDPDGNTLTGQAIGWSGATVRFTFKGTIDMNKVHEGDRIGINVTTRDPAGRFTKTPTLTGPKTLKDPDGNTVFNLEWNTDGQTVVLTRTNAAATGRFTFTLHNGQSYFEQNLSEATRPAGKVQFTLADRTYTLDYAKWESTTVNDYACTTDVTAGSGRRFVNSGSVTLWFDYGGCQDQNRLLAGQDPNTDSQDLIFYMLVHKPDMGEIGDIPANQLYYNWNGLYDTRLSGLISYDFYRQFERTDKTPANAQEAAEQLTPGQYASFPNQDGTYVLAINMGARQSPTALRPGMDQVRKKVTKQTDLDAITRMDAANMSATTLSGLFYLYPKDGGEIFRADMTMTTLRNGVASSYDGVLRTNPGGALGDGQSGIRFNANGGTGSMDDLIGDATTNVTLPKNTITRTGYEFKGWSTSRDGSTGLIGDNTSTTYPKSGMFTTLYAQWEASTASITYDGNGADSPAEQSGNVGDRIVLAAAPTRSGYVFTGWKSPDGSVYQAGDTISMPKGGLKLTAQWEAGQAALSYDANGGQNAPAAQTGKTGDKLTVSDKQPTRTGYTFTGWTGPDGKTVNAGDTLTMPAGGVKLTAGWKANTYTVKYDANHGSGSMKDQQFTYDQPGQLAANTLTRDGWTFTGWKTPDGTILADGQSVTNLTDKGTITLTAQWQAGDAAVTYDPNGGQNAPAAQAGKTGDTITVSNDRPTRDGYEFTGWTSPTGQPVQPGSQVTIPAGGLKLTAGWKAGESVIRFDANGGQGAPPDMTGVTDQKAKLPDQKPSRDGYTFTGWASPDGRTIQPGDQITYPAGGMTLTAGWQAGDAAVSYDANGGTNAPAAQAGKTGDQVTVPDRTPTRDGYTFTGWASPDGKTVQPGDTVTIPAGGLKLAAQWTADAGTIRFDANGGQGAPADMTGVTDQSMTIPEQTPSRDGYQFTGWQAGDGRTVQPGDTLTMPAGGVTLTAGWQAGDAAVSFDANGGQNAPAAQAGRTDETITLSKDRPTRDGYTFTGWTAPDGTTLQPGDRITLPAGGVKLTAGWLADRQSIAYEANGGQGDTTPTDGETDGETTVGGNAFTRDGYTFTGWNTMKDGSGTGFQPGDTTVMPAGGLTLHAQWQADPSRITYDGNGGTGDTPATSGFTDQEATVSGNAFTRDGYEFTGWKTPDGKTVQPGDTLTLPAGGLTLTAQWKALPAQLTYDPNGGTGDFQPFEGTTDSQATFTDRKPERPGYTFTGWDLNGSLHQPGDTITLPVGGLKVTASWTADPSRITYEANQGQGDMAPTTGVTDQQVSLTGNTFTRPGYTFTGWNTAKDGTGTAYADKAGMTLPVKGTTLYAQWTADASKVTFNANQGQGRMDDLTGVTDQQVTLPDNAFTRKGYTFAGWNTKPDGSGDQLGRGDAFTLTAGPTVLYAQWTADASKITYDTGGNGSIDPTVGVTDQQVTLSERTPTRNGYTFIGWSDGSGRTWMPGDQVTLPAGGMTLTAGWRADKATVRFDLNGGTGSYDPVDGVTDGTIVLPSDKPENGCARFTGWKGSDNVTYQPGDTVTLPAGGITLTAQWDGDPDCPSLAQTGVTGGPIALGLAAIAGIAGAVVSLIRRRA